MSKLREGRKLSFEQRDALSRFLLGATFYEPLPCGISAAEGIDDAGHCRHAAATKLLHDIVVNAKRSHTGKPA